MTLKKHVLISSHVLLAFSFYIAPSNSLASATGYNGANRSFSDTTLPFLLKIEVKDTVRYIVSTAKSARPEVRMNAGVVQFVERFTKKNQKDLQEIKRRSSNAFAVIEPILTRHDIPVQLKYLAVVESELKTDARSKAGAVGMWQLMSQTARELGLKVNGKTDERKNFRKSTAAAAKYLKTLYKYYGDWLLTIAAYNSGPGVVNTAIKKSGSRNFWKLQHHLSAETRGHVKRYIAIHYFFEDSGSVTTLTKAENVAYLKELEKYNDAVEQSAKLSDSVVLSKPNAEALQTQ